MSTDTTTAPATPPTTSPATPDATDAPPNGTPAGTAITGPESANLAAGEAQAQPSRGRQSTVSWTLALAVYTWLAMTELMNAGLHRVRVRAGEEDPEEGSILSEVAWIVGILMIAGVVILAVRGKATTLTNNICTNADPTTC